MNGKKGFLLIIIGAALILGTASLALAQESSAAADEVEAANLAVTEKWIAFVQDNNRVKDAVTYRERHKEIFQIGYLIHDAWSAAEWHSEPGFDREGEVAYLKAFPDWTVNLESVVADGNLVFVHYSAGGTFENRLSVAGIANLEPSGKRVVEEGVYIFRFEDGKIAEVWQYVDSPVLWVDKAILLERKGADSEAQQIYDLNKPK